MLSNDRKCFKWQPEAPREKEAQSSKRPNALINQMNLQGRGEPGAAESMPYARRSSAFTRSLSAFMYPMV